MKGLFKAIAPTQRQDCYAAVFDSSVKVEKTYNESNNAFSVDGSFVEVNADIEAVLYVTNDGHPLVLKNFDRDNSTTPNSLARAIEVPLAMDSIVNLIGTSPGAELYRWYHSNRQYHLYSSGKSYRTNSSFYAFR